MPSTGRPELNTTSGMRGLASPTTLAGPPERMMARGAKASMRAGSRAVNGQDLAIDTALAHAAGDQLGELAAEIENEHAVVLRACV